MPEKTVAGFIQYMKDTVKRKIRDRVESKGQLQVSDLMTIEVVSGYQVNLFVDLRNFNEDEYEYYWRLDSARNSEVDVASLLRLVHPSELPYEPA